MTMEEFKLATEDMNRRAKGDGVTLNVWFKSGEIEYDVAWGFLREGLAEVIMLHREDAQLVYTTPDAISHIEMLV